MGNTDMTKFAAWFKARIVNAGYSLASWGEADGTAAQILLITSGELSVTVVEDFMTVKGVVGPSTAAEKRKGRVKATAERSTVGKDSEDDRAVTEEEDSECKEDVKATKKINNKKVDAALSIVASTCPNRRQTSREI